MTAAPRLSREGDEPALRELWRRVFGDPEEIVDSFFKLLYEPGRAVVVSSGGRAESMMFSLSGASLALPDGGRVPCAYIYSLATLPERRGLGLGAAVARAAAQTAGEGLACLLPADGGLYGWYAGALGAKALTYCREAELDAASLPPASGRAEPVDAREYLALRELLLEKTAHAVLTEPMLRWQQAICEYGGGLFRFPGGCAVCEYGGGLLSVKELLAPDGAAMSALASLAAVFRPESVAVRTPLFFDGPGKARPFVVASSPSGAPLPAIENAWWGPAFD